MSSRRENWVLPKYVLMSVRNKEVNTYLAEIALDNLGVVEMVIGKDDDGFVGVLDITCELDNYLRYHATSHIDSIIEDCQTAEQALRVLEVLSVA